MVEQNFSPKLLFLSNRQAPDPLPQLLRFQSRALRSHLGEDQGELFAAVTASDVFRASVQPEERCHLVQHQVARFVSESVVESFEVVDIDHQDGDGEPSARGASQLSLQ